MLPIMVYPRDGPPKAVKAWFDNGDPTMSITGQLAKELGLNIGPDSAGSSVVRSPSARITIGGMR